jgi:hypothetical protein
MPHKWEEWCRTTAVQRYRCKRGGQSPRVQRVVPSRSRGVPPASHMTSTLKPARLQFCGHLQLFSHGPLTCPSLCTCEEAVCIGSRGHCRVHGLIATGLDSSSLLLLCVIAQRREVRREVCPGSSSFQESSSKKSTLPARLLAQIRLPSFAVGPTRKLPGSDGIQVILGQGKVEPGY